MSKFNISKHFGGVSDKIEKYLLRRDSVLENDYVELLGDGTKLVGFFVKASNFFLQKKFEQFLKGLNQSNDVVYEEQLEKLKNYINSQERAEFISDTFSKVLTSKSSKACLVMGVILNKVLESDDKLKHEHLVALNALMNFFDHDIDNYTFLYTLSKNERKNLFPGLINKKARDSGKDIPSLWMTIEKCASEQLIKRGFDLDLDIDEDPLLSGGEVEEYYKFNEAGKLLFTYINRATGIS